MMLSGLIFSKAVWIYRRGSAALVNEYIKGGK